MAQNTKTPIPFFYDMPLREMQKWIMASNELNEERAEAMEKRKKK